MKQIFLFLITCSTFSFLQSQEKNETIIVTGDFSIISVYAGIEVNLIRGKENKIVLLNDKSDDASTFGYKIKNNTLKLRTEIDKKLSLGNILVDLYYRNDIEELKLFQGSKAFLKDSIKQTNFIIKVKEASSLQGLIVTDKTTIVVATGGKVSLEGYSSVIQIKATTGGICSVEELSSKQTNINASIGSLVHATSTTLMEVEASTGAIVRVHGSPEKLITKTMLGGKIKQIN